MKTLILLSIVFTMAFIEPVHSKHAVDQACPGDVTLSSQAEVDAFNCTELTGRLVISGPDITNLDALSSLQKVHGDFLIQETSLTALASLSALESVGGRLDISSNPVLSDINGLKSLKGTGGVTFYGNASLTNLDGFSSLTEINGDLSIQLNQALADIDGFPLLRSINGDGGVVYQGQVDIINNVNLKKISGLNSLTTAVSINIQNNPTLVDINGFTSLVTCHLSISQNDALTDIPGFLALTTARGLAISENNSLSNLDGFPAISEAGSLSIVNNRSLKSINGFNNLKAISDLITSSGEVQLNISNNSSLESFQGLSLLEEVSGNNVAAVNIINNPALKNIGGLSSLSHINGAFRYLRIETNILLENINGISQLKPGDLANPINISIIQNQSLMICDGLLTYFQTLGKDEVLSLKDRGIINVTDNGAGCIIGDFLNGGPIAISCDGNVVLFSQAKVNAFSCTEVKGSLTISGSDITNLNTLSSLRTVGGNLSISDNPNLEKIDLPALETNLGSITISGNANLNSISGFNNLFQATSISIAGNPKLGSISGFNSLEQVPAGIGGGGFAIVQNDALTNLPGFDALITTTNLRIVNNPKLLALDGFPSLTNVIGDFQISNNESLKTINGFNKLTAISGLPRIVLNSALLIENNASLETLAGLSSLRFISAPLDAGRIPPVPGTVTVSVTGNPKLTQCCALQPLLDFLYSSGTLPPNVRINISENGGGCTIEDILACVPQRVLSFTLLDRQTQEVIRIFENEVTIDLADPRSSHLMLQANTSPQQVGSVEFNFDEHIRRTENSFPYQFILPQLTPGAHTVRTDVYSEHQLKGEKGISRVATFNVINSATVISFDVVNQARQTLMNLGEGDEININDPSFNILLFRANTLPDRVAKVELFLNDRLVAVEHGFPYEVYGNRIPGDYTLEAIPYIKIRGNQYVPGTSLKIHFKVVSEDAGSSSQLVMNNQSNDERLLKVGESPEVTIFPVPVDSELYIKIDDGAGTDPLITVRTIYGLTVYQDFYSKSKSINTLNLQAGVYYLQVTGYGGFQKVVKFIKK